ncbi:hypothetical protein F4824DRAFT_458064 [Ustulina deusta]|nr:hypothetical protein F4824DRAFT_458064 [Ustulina deusta]
MDFGRPNSSFVTDDAWNGYPVIFNDKTTLPTVEYCPHCPQTPHNPPLEQGWAGDSPSQTMGPPLLSCVTGFPMGLLAPLLQPVQLQLPLTPEYTACENDPTRQTLPATGPTLVAPVKKEATKATPLNFGSKKPACISCRQRKSRCSKGQPCGSCERSGRRCVYVESKRFRSTYNFQNTYKHDPIPRAMTVSSSKGSRNPVLPPRQAMNLDRGNQKHSNH